MNQVSKFGFKKNSKDLGQASVLCLPYTGKSVEMLIILPNRGTTLDTVEKNIGKFLRNLRKAKKSNWLDGFHYKTLKSVYIPKFKLKSELNVVQPMQKVGVTDMFSDKADFSNMVSKADIYVSVIKQKAFIEGTLLKSLLQKFTFWWHYEIFFSQWRGNRGCCSNRSSWYF